MPLILPKHYGADFSIPGKQPLRPVKINWKNKITKGLIGAYLRDFSVNLVAKRAVTKVGSVEIQVGPGGVGVGGFGTNDSVDTGAAPYTGSNNRTVFAVIDFTDFVAGGSPCIYSAGTVATGERWDFRIRQNNDTLRVEIQGVGDNSPLSILNKKIVAVALVLNGTTIGDHRYMLDGEFDNASGSTTVNTGTANNSLWGNSISGEANTELDNAILHLGLEYNRALTNNELLSLYLDPYQIFRSAVPMQVFVPSVAATATATLTGTGTLAAVGEAEAEATASAAGVGALAAVGASLAVATWTGAAIGAMAAVAVEASELSASGVATFNVVGLSEVVATWTAAATATFAGVVPEDAAPTQFAEIVTIPDHGAKLVDDQGRAMPDLQRYLDDITFQLNADRRVTPDYTVATVPDASTSYGQIMVTDEVGGATLAYSDLTDWRRVRDDVVIST